ncbi:hypothetical protein Q8A67_019759 [Cirrhinus molitorella]|uniref:Uncharacterized protein n=1 Tax=Cirrhinus molitorella TaxID=172907 RepID=A0AA88TQ09_9TELE|nr:hypothetical protein Q8A67_019759 [Cirrhinus molitorella]
MIGSPSDVKDTRVEERLHLNASNKSSTDRRRSLNYCPYRYHNHGTNQHRSESSNKVPEQKKSSTLVSVAKMNEPNGARQNPAAYDITEDELGLEAVEGGIAYRPWRSHTLTHGSNLPSQINVKTALFGAIKLPVGRLRSAAESPSGVLQSSQED